jgi:hypothetical protein
MERWQCPLASRSREATKAVRIVDAEDNVKSARFDDGEECDIAE